METKIVIQEYKVNSITGDITALVKSITKDGGATWDGPLVPYNCDAKMFAVRFGGNVEAFEAWIAKEHTVHGENPVLSEALAKRKGRVIG